MEYIRPSHFSELIPVANEAINLQAEVAKEKWSQFRKRFFWLVTGGCFALIAGLSFSPSIQRMLGSWLSIASYSAILVPWLKWAGAFFPFYTYIRMSKRTIYVAALCVVSLLNGLYSSSAHGIAPVLYSLFANILFVATAAAFSGGLVILGNLMFKYPDIALYLISLLRPSDDPALGDDGAIQRIATYIGEQMWKRSDVKKVAEIASVRLQSEETFYSFLGTFLNLIPVLIAPLALTVLGLYLVVLTGHSLAVSFDTLTYQLGIPESFAVALAIYFLILAGSARVANSRMRNLSTLRVIWGGCTLSEGYEGSVEESRVNRFTLGRALWKLVRVFFRKYH